MFVRVWSCQWIIGFHLYRKITRQHKKKTPNAADTTSTHEIRISQHFKLTVELANDKIGPPLELLWTLICFSLILVTDSGSISVYNLCVHCFKTFCIVWQVSFSTIVLSSGIDRHDDLTLLFDLFYYYVLIVWLKEGFNLLRQLFAEGIGDEETLFASIACIGYLAIQCSFNWFGYLITICSFIIFFMTSFSTSGQVLVVGTIP